MCKQEKELKLFHKSKNRRLGVATYCKECINKKHRERDSKDRVKARKKTNEWQKKKRQEDLPYCLWAAARSRARKQNIPFNLTREDIIIPEKCPVFGTPFESGLKGEFKSTAASLDKINPKLGYVKGNVIVVSLRANLIKRDATIGELIKLADFYKTFN